MAAAIGACGGSDGGSDEAKTFNEKGYGISFEYPGNFERTEDVSLDQSAGQADATVALAISEDSSIFVQRYSLQAPVSEDNADDVRKELDTVLGQLTGTEVSGRRLDVGGPVAFRHELEKLEKPENGRSTIVTVFDGDTEYFLNCQSVPEEREEIEAACDQAIETIELK